MATLPDKPNGDSAERETANALNSIASAMTGMLDQGRERNAIQTEIALRTLELSQNADQLQHDLSLKEIEYTNQQQARRYGLGRLIVIIAGIALLAVMSLIGLVVGMVFYGSEMQSQNALTMLGYGFAAIGGGGVLLLFVVAANVVYRWWRVT